ncbi:MAG: 3-hydroxyacyl-CoA dehydrogenase NAD-binding domain-containing protein [Wenzhouxiangellaceae bacterium]
MNATSKQTYRHWQLEHDIDNVAWLSIDRAGASTNVLSNEVLNELQDVILHLEQHRPAGLVLMSGKPGQFIAGADVNEFDEVTDLETGRKQLNRVHDLFTRIENLNFPTAVAFEGFCLGGGLELSLCFDWIIARNDEHTRIGFPEVNLGIYPGFGGSARTPQRIGGQNAMQIMLTGQMLRPGAARGMGLVDQLVGEHETLRWAARRAVLAGKKHRQPGLLARATNLAPARKLLAGIMRKKTAAKAPQQHYPAPYKLIDAWEACGNDQEHMLRAEVRNVPELLVGDTSRNLRRVFKLMEALKAQGKQSDFKAHRVHVIGAGVMGGDIAAWCVLKGLEVTLQDREMKYIEPAIKRAKQLFRKKLRTDAKVMAAMSRLRADVDGDGVARADVVIEAIFENLEAKQALYKNIEPQMQPHALLATNTSALPLADLAKVLQQPKRLIGLHYFNPVAKMPLVEIVYDEQLTNEDLVADGASFVRQIGKYPLPVKSTPGFLVNRVLAPYMANAIELYRDGIPKEAIDKAAVRFGMPMGPVELADTVGLDVGMSVIKTVGIDTDGSKAKYMKNFVDAGKLGKKSGEGFYTWEKGKPKRDKDAAQGHDLHTLGLQLVQPYLDECAACAKDGIVASDDLIDAGMIFGTGFAPFRGGPLHYLRSRPAEDATAAKAAPGTPSRQSATSEQASAAQQSNDEPDTGSQGRSVDKSADSKQSARKTGKKTGKKTAAKTAKKVSKKTTGKAAAKKSSSKKTASKSTAKDESADNRNETATNTQQGDQS